DADSWISARKGAETSVAQVEAFRRALAENGYVDGQNLSIEFRWARGQYDQLPAMAAELVRHPVDLLIGGSEPAPTGAKSATPTIPSIFSRGRRPNKRRPVEAFNRAPGHDTGTAYPTHTLHSNE